MIELFNLIKAKREKTIKVKCEQVSYWRSESEKVNSFIKYIEDNINKFCIDVMDIKYDTGAINDRYVKSFDLIIYTDAETYSYLEQHFASLLEKYNRYAIKLDDIKFRTLTSSDYSRLRIH